jgi:uncharacterized protein (TIGR02217 family)
MAFTFVPVAMPGLSPAYALNPNPTFQSYSGPYTGIPAQWFDWASGAATVNARDAAGAWNAGITGAAGANGGVAGYMGGFNAVNATWPGAGWYVLEADIYLASGGMTGAGVYVQFDDVAFSTQIEAATLDFTTDPDVTGAVRGAGVVGTRYQFRKLAQSKNPAAVAAILYAMSHWDGFGHSTAAANLIDWYKCAIRPATLAEVAAGNSQYGLPVFPLLPGQATSVSKAPKWSTKVKRAASGRERRTALWPYPLWQFELSYEVIRQRPTNAELAALWSFFNTVQGQYQPWLFLDPTDYQQALPVAFGAGDGSTTTFQIGRAFTQTEIEPVYAPFGTAIYVNGAATTAYSLSANGRVTFTSPPAVGALLTWTGCYYFGCRFLEDDLTFEQLVAQLWSGKSVKFTSLRV